MDSKVQDALVSSFAGKGFSLDDAQVSALLAYLSLLEKWNRRVRLTGLRDPVEIAARLLPESLDFLRLWEPREGERALDVGAGAGIVGIPIGILFPGVEVVLVESQGRKAAFLGEVVRELGFGRFQVIGERVEGLAGKMERGGPEKKGVVNLRAYDTILCRAVAPVSEILPRVWPLLAAAGRVLIRQGARAEDELAAARPGMDSLGSVLLGEAVLEGGRIIALGHGG